MEQLFFTVLERDVFTVPADEISEVRVVDTWVRGGGSSFAEALSSTPPHDIDAPRYARRGVVRAERETGALSRVAASHAATVARV